MKLRDYQIECLEIIKNMKPGSYLIQMATGLGKCFAKNTKILKYNGNISYIQNLKKDDLIMGWDNKPRTIISTTKGKEMMYEIKQNKKDSYIVNESHILSLKCTNIMNKRITDINNNKYTSGDICNISVKDYIQCSKTFKHCMKGFSSNLIEFDEKKLIIEPYFLGLWLGDGTSRTLSITTPDKEIKNYLTDFSKLNNFNLRIENLKNNKANTYHLSNNWTRTNFSNYFKDNLKNNKHIPKIYKINSSENRLQLLAGLLDSDGYLNTSDNSTFEIISKYKNLSDDIVFICRSLGLSCRQTIKYNKKYNKNYYKCSIFGNTSMIPTKIKRKQAINNSNKNNLMYKIEVIKKEIDDYYGFELKEDNKMFLLSDFTVVHNTVVFTNYINNIKGRCLIISHREELVNQPLKYISRSKGIEMGKFKSDNEDVISSCISSLVRRYKKFKVDDFDTIIVDECQHSAAASYVKVLNYFKPRLVLGFTATPNRADNKKLDHIFSRIIYKYDLLTGIKNKYLSNIYCKRVYVKLDLKKVKSKSDYQISDLEKELIDSENPKSIGEIYLKHAKGQTLIFGTTVKHCEEISKFIPGSQVISANTKNRAEILEDFKNKKIACIINCMIFTEGTDLPGIETIIIARPTKSAGLYSQMVGRGTRLAEGKEKLTLIDCVGVSTDLNLCTAPTLLGIDYNDEKVKKDEGKIDLEGNLFDLPAQIEKRENHPDNWKINYKIVNIWANKKGYNLHNVNWFKHSDGSFSLQIKNIKLKTSPIDELGYLTFKNQRYEAQDFFDRCRKQLDKKYKEHKYIWDLSIMKYWGYKPATTKQLQLIKRFLPDFNTDKLNKLQANQILTKLMNK